MSKLIVLKKFLNHKIIKAGKWYTLNNFLLKGMAFLTLPIYTRILTTEQYGFVSLFFTWVSIFSIIVGLSLTESIRRAKYDYSSNYDEFVSSISMLSLLLLLGLLLLTFLFVGLFEKITSFPIQSVVFMIIVGFAIHIRELALIKFRFEYKYKVVTAISLISTIAGTVLSIYLIFSYFSSESQLGRIYGEGMSLIFFAVILFIYLVVKGKKLINFEYWKYAIVLSAPLIVHNLSNMINNHFDRIIVNNYFGEASTGVYSFGYNVGSIVLVISISMSQAWLPWYFEKFKNGNYDIIRSKAKIYRDTYTLLYLCVLMISSELIKIMAEDNYWEGLKVVPWVFMAFYFQFMYAFEVNVEFALKRTKLISIGTTLAAALNIVLNLIFIPIGGYLAAAITTAISYFFLFAFHYFITARILKVQIYGFRFHAESILYVFSITVYFVLFQDNTIFRIVGILIPIYLFIKSMSKRKIFSS
jgi:O-antigen/teichoic acid export membrane protein